MAELCAGHTTTVPLTGRTFDVLVGAANTDLDCLDGCSELWWAGWARVP